MCDISKETFAKLLIKVVEMDGKYNKFTFFLFEHFLEIQLKLHWMWMVNWLSSVAQPVSIKKNGKSKHTSSFKTVLQ